MDAVSGLALASGLSWASGLRLYATVFAVGILGKFHYIHLPPGLQILTHPAVFGLAGFLLFIEFLADKFPGIDSLWDAAHTFIRIPAGALLAWGAIDSSDPWIAACAVLLGGTLAGATHFAKAGGRAVINTSPEPMSNWAASFGEDGLVALGLWAALAYPTAFLIGLAIFVLFLFWFLPKVWRGLKYIAGRVRTLLNGTAAQSPAVTELDKS